MGNDHHCERGDEDQAGRQTENRSPVLAEISPGRVKSVAIQERRQKNQEHDIRFQPDFGQSRKEAENKASEYQDYRVGNIERPGRSNQNHQHDEQAND